MVVVIPLKTGITEERSAKMNSMCTKLIKEAVVFFCGGGDFVFLCVKCVQREGGGWGPGGWRRLQINDRVKWITGWWILRSHDGK